MADIDVDFGQAIFDLAGNALGLSGVETTLGGLAIDAISHAYKADPPMSEDEKLAHYQLLRKINTGVTTKAPVTLTPTDVPMLRRALNRTVDILTFGRIVDILEAAPKKGA